MTIYTITDTLINGTVSGFITVNGTGAVGPDQIGNYSVTIAPNDHAPFTWTTFNSGVLVGSQAFATPTNLMFDSNGCCYFGFSLGAGSGWLVNWQTGGLYALLGSYTDVAMSQSHNEVYSIASVPVPGPEVGGGLVGWLLIGLLIMRARRWCHD